jgi:fido (protein-threonine AMPylation protein)
MKHVPWYKRYTEHRESVYAAEALFKGRCQKLSVNPSTVMNDLWQEMVSRMVHESNWQEDLFLNLPRTRELAELAFNDPPLTIGPHLDFSGILSAHRSRVIKLKRESNSNEEIAAYNLTNAHRALLWITSELMYRQIAHMGAMIQEMEAKEEINGVASMARLTRLKDGVNRKTKELEEADRPIRFPLNEPITMASQFVAELRKVLKLRIHSLLNVDYIHFLHQLVTMGLISTTKCGVFRKGPVYIESNPNLVFPPASMVPGLMEEFCVAFPIFGRFDSKSDLIMKAAKVSHRFVTVHPYADGNGRLSRLVMNLVLCGRFLPVALKADSHGRHRYVQALRRADGGNYEPLACLIALSLIESYKKLNASISE